MAFSFMQTISFMYLLIIRTCATSLVSHNEECLALFEFKQSISHQPYASFDVAGFQKVDHNPDCCLWDGVVCSNKGHVIGLDLSRSYLHGPINSNSSLFNLVHLQMLNLSMNDFVESRIPSEIARLKQLRSLDLSNSSFSGQIPIEISHLMRLTLLDLSANPLKLQSPSLECLLQNLTRLEELHLSGVNISSFVPPFLANFSSLRSLDLEGCWLQDKFASSIFHLPKLKFLSMAHNPSLTGSLPEFQNDTLLEYLDLSATSFAGSIPESISRLNHLVFLSLHGCYLSGCIPRSLSNMTQLMFLSLGQHEFMGLEPSFPRLISNAPHLEVCEKGLMHEWIRTLTNIESLILLRINIYGEILPSLANLTKLIIFRMRGCDIYGHIPSSFMNLTQLRVIDLRGNQLQGQISSSFSNFKSLEDLHLQRNKFSKILDLDTFVGLTKLKSLFLDDNRISCVDINNHTNQALLPELENLGLSSCNLIEIPSFLRLQKKLSSLLLADNKIKGAIPEWIMKNTRETLQVLDLSYNSITGFHGHPNFLPWVRLEYFDLSYNKLQGQLPIPPLTIIIYDVSNNNLTGEIPPLICEAKYLGVLSLSSNNMTGTLPPCLSNLSNSLLVLGLSKNNFHGPMMNAFTYGSLIKSLDLSENLFTGQLSKSLANCSCLEFINLGDLFGAINQSLSTIESPFLKLQIIDLSDNGFNGQLPDKLFRTWNAMKSLNVGKSSVMESELSLGQHSYTAVSYVMILTNKGVKTEYRHILSIFSAIDLSRNNFEGPIPESLDDLLGLQSINLSYNHLTGHVLPSLGNLKNLESLDLSGNELSGEIPHELLQLGFLEIFNVSFNHLHGAIPQGRQLDTFENNSYMGNLGLCGAPLSKKCQTSMTPTLNPANNEYESLLPSDIIDWIIIFLGVGCGLVIGVVFGNLLCVRYGDWLIGSIN